MTQSTLREPLSVPGQATDAPPGSARKIRVLMERAARRESLFNPNDNLRRMLPGVDEEIELPALPDADAPDDYEEEDEEQDYPAGGAA